MSEILILHARATVTTSRPITRQAAVMTPLAEGVVPILCIRVETCLTGAFAGAGLLKIKIWCAGPTLVSIRPKTVYARGMALLA